MSKIGVIGGSGLYEIKGVKIQERKKVATPFGSPSDKYIIGTTGKTEVIFLPRHGAHHNIPPHKINYRANIWGFKKLGVSRIISINAVGGIKKGLKPGDIVVPDQIVDMTKNRKFTFYDGKTGVIHIDFSNPFCPEMRQALLKAGKHCRVALKSSGTYVVTEGPRLETAAEIRALRIMGSDIVGMTAMPEASLAREIKICYAGIMTVANYAAGISRTKLTTTEVMETMKAQTEKIKRLLKEVFTVLPKTRKCPCKDALTGAKV